MTFPFYDVMLACMPEKTFTLDGYRDQPDPDLESKINNTLPQSGMEYR